jgi:hypothetical protein
MADSGGREKTEKSSRSKWLWPAGVMATSLAGAALLLLRGCWHRKMSWPVRMQGCAYQVCLGCGAKRLFDEKNFRSYGPLRYDVNELIAWQRLQRPPTKPEAEQQRPAS